MLPDETPAAAVTVSTTVPRTSTPLAWSADVDQKSPGVAPIPPVENASAETEFASRVIAIVPDDPVIGELIQYVINDEAGWSVALPPDTGQAVDMLRNGEADALILDVPFADGLDEEPLKRLQADSAEGPAPVILLSAVNLSQLQSAVERGLASVCIGTPLDIDDLVGVVRRLVSREPHSTVGGSILETRFTGHPSPTGRGFAPQLS